MVTDQKEVKDVKNPEKSEEIKVEEKTTEIELTSQKNEEAADLKEEIENQEVEVEKPSSETEAEKQTDTNESPAPENQEENEESKDEQTEESVVDEDDSKEEEELETVSEKPEDETEKSEADDMMTLLNEHFSKFKKGKIVEGVVVSVDERSVLVDIGFKSESAIPIREFSSTSVPEAGTKIKVYIDSVEDGSGRLKLSKKKADFYLNLENLQKLKDNNETITGILRRRVKGGMIVEIENLEAFLPGSQISTKPIPNLDQFIGKKGKFKLLKIDEDRRNIIVSRKKVLIEEQESKLSDLRSKLQEGAELDGEVRNITDYGAFIDLGGIDGLLHITDMSWGHINHPSDMLNIGDKVKVKVLNYDEENDKVSLGLKQLVPHPWENIEAKYPEGTIVSGKVVNITNYGVFVELESGVEGLVHVSEMSWTKKIKHPKQLLKLGDSIKAIVLATSKEERRISLGIKQMEANPWLTIEERYPIGMELKGKVKTITPFGIFVEIEDEIEGLVHISDISWTKRIYHPKEVFNKGQEIDVKVLSIDKTLHRIALGVKQLTEDPWENLDEKLPINTEITAKIAKIISKGILVDVEVNGNVVEGFAPLSHLAIPGLKKTELAFDLGEEIPLKIIELDLENRRLILSVKAYFFAKDSTKLQQFIDEHEAKIAQKLEEKKSQKEHKPRTKKIEKTDSEEKPDSAAEIQKDDQLADLETPEDKLEEQIDDAEIKLDIETENETEEETSEQAEEEKLEGHSEETKIEKQEIVEESETGETGEDGSVEEDSEVKVDEKAEIVETDETETKK
ncbi:MAG: hypothetical protein APR54_12660 [Candidatus Cloacimonas sp. SDB]|nr:MAG: hypothetical protein APR54_12660 [Candidatus Cloacimonas sp. SDB]